MLRHAFASFIACCVVGLAALALASPAVITGSVIGEGGRPVAGATVQVVQTASMPPCETRSAADGTFSVACMAEGRHVVRASFGELRSWEQDVELGKGHEIHLNFLLLPAATTSAAGATERAGFWSSPLPNPVLATWQGNPITMRLLAIGLAAASFLLGALTMMSLGRWFGVETRPLSAGEVGDMVLNPHMPMAGERVTPVAVVGARGASASVSYGADEIATALAARRYGLVFVSLVIAPGLFALFALALAVAILVGQEVYLFFAMLLVPAGFVLTPLVIGIQGFRRRGKIG